KRFDDVTCCQATKSWSNYHTCNLRRFSVNPWSHPPLDTTCYLSFLNERQRDILLTHTQKTTDADHQCSYLAGLIDKHIVNLADRTLCLVVDVLLVVVGDRPAIGGKTRQRVSRERRGGKRGHRGKCISVFHHLFS